MFFVTVGLENITQNICLVLFNDFICCCVGYKDRNLEVYGSENLVFLTMLYPICWTWTNDWENLNLYAD